MGKLNYLLVLYGGTQDKYLRKIQVICNNTIRFVMGAGTRTSTMELVSSLNWLTAREMISYHTLMTAWKLVWMQIPRLLAQQDTLDDDRMLQTTIPRLQNTTMGVRWRVRTGWNKLPLEIRSIGTLPKFKTSVKKWIKGNRLTGHQPEDELQQDENYYK